MPRKIDSVDFVHLLMDKAAKEVQIDVVKYNAVLIHIHGKYYMTKNFMDMDSVEFGYLHRSLERWENGEFS